jgi:hypothetical protein
LKEKENSSSQDTACPLKEEEELQHQVEIIPILFACVTQ